MLSFLVSRVRVSMCVCVRVNVCDAALSPLPQGHHHAPSSAEAATDGHEARFPAFGRFVPSPGLTRWRGVF